MMVFLQCRSNVGLQQRVASSIPKLGAVKELMQEGRSMTRPFEFVVSLGTCQAVGERFDSSR